MNLPMNQFTRLFRVRFTLEDNKKRQDFHPALQTAELRPTAARIDTQFHAEAPQFPRESIV